MRAGSFKAFWIAFFCTAAVLAPLTGTAVWLAGRQAQQQAAHSESGVAVAVPGTENRMTVLVCVADAPPAFIEVQLDAAAGTVRLAALPAQTEVQSDSGALTLADCYAAAGPARVTALLNRSLGAGIDRYLALSPDTLAALAEPLGSVRASLSGALAPPQLAQMADSGGVEEWTAASAHRWLQQAAAKLPPADTAAARAALWQAWLRQQLGRLPDTLPDGLRRRSGSLLTNLTAQDLYTLGDTLGFLAAAQAPSVEGCAAGGAWDAQSGRYVPDEDDAAALKAFFSASAAAGASAGSSAPYPSTTVSGGQ